MSDRINKDSAANHHIVLLGYMGCGKSTAGRLLAQQLQLPFVDLDEYLTNKYGDSIPNLFLKNLLFHMDLPLDYKKLKVLQILLIHP